MWPVLIAGLLGLAPSAPVDPLVPVPEGCEAPPAAHVVFIGTVDHWHAQVAIDAMEAGKHVYCEKPMTRYLDEAFAIYDTVKRTGRKFQVGSQYCTEGKWHQAAELVRAGAIGPLVVGGHHSLGDTRFH